MEPHNHDRDHEDEHGRARSEEPVRPETDAASRSLSDALRASFRLLTGIMVLVVVAFLLTGVKSIEPQQAGIVKVFGKVVGTVGPGLAYTWPYPIGEIEVVDVKEGRVEILDFWMQELPGEQTKDLDKRTVIGQGLRPGWDGALLTGDRNLVHVKLACTYAIRDPLTYKRHVVDANELVRSVVCSGAISAAATRSAENLMLSDVRGFAADIRRSAQEQLDRVLGSPGAIAVTGINVPMSTWPLKARPAYNAAQQAGQEAQKIRDSAITDARKALQGAAGPNYVQLVGDVWAGTSREAADPNQYDLIGRYDAAQRDKSPTGAAAAAALLAKIDEVLLSHQTGGDARGIIEQAQGKRVATVQRARTTLDNYNKSLPGYLENPDFMLNRLWAEARDSIFQMPTLERFYLTETDGKTVLRLSRDPDLFRRLQRELMKTGKEGEGK